MPLRPVTATDQVLGAAKIVAPVLLLISTLAAAAGAGLGEDHANGAIQIYAMAAFGLVVVGLTRLVEGAMPRLAAALLVIGALGVAGGVAWGIDKIHNAETGTTAQDAGAAGVFALNIPGIVFPLAMLGFGLALVRAAVEPRWSGIALALAGILFPVSRIGGIELLAIVVDVLFLVALAPLGWAILQGRVPAPSPSTASPAVAVSAPGA